MTATSYRALVVDDEPAVRMLTMRELSRNGFTCDAARDGSHAKELLADTRYDAVVTDLRMPEMNGHALAVELLNRPNPPVVVILTGVTEPRLAKDLIARGVDDILFKPIDQSILASKVRALVERRAMQTASAALAPPSPADHAPPGAEKPTDPAEFDARISEFIKIAPISGAALDVVKLTSLDTCETRQLTRAIEMDAALSAELLRLANSALYSQTGRAAAGIEEAVVRIGQKRTGELALAMSTMSAMKPAAWMDGSLAWRRSLAAGVAIDQLIAKGGHSSIGAGLFLSALMHPLGRFVLSTLYPDRYQVMLQLSQHTGEALQVYEDHLFQRTHADAMSRILQAWNIPPVICEPLKYSRSQPELVEKLPEPLRTKVELLQVAVIIARFAVGRWEPWDLVQLPSTETLRTLRIESLEDFVQQTRIDVEEMGQMTDFAANRSLRSPTTLPPASAQHDVAYCNLSTGQFDPMLEMLRSMGITPHSRKFTELSSDEPAIINCIGAAMQDVPDVLIPGSSHVVITDGRHPNDLPSSAVICAFPTSVRALRSAVLKAAIGRPRDSSIAALT